MILLGLGLAIYSPTFALRPLEGDNLYILAWVDQAPVEALLPVDPGIYPEWRPLAFLTIWLEHQFVQLRVVAVHHFVNILIWVTCAWLVYRLVDELASDRAAGLLAGALVLTDQRSHQAVAWIVERQTPLACAFGLLAALLVVRARQRRLTPGERLSIGLLLVASALSKEYGLAFAGAMFVYGLWQRKDLATVAAIAGLGYGALRLMLTGGAWGPYCGEMGYGFDLQVQCVDPRAAASAGQMAYNVMATALAIPLPGMFDDSGMIYLNIARLRVWVALAAAAMVGILLGGPRLRLLALLPVCNALLSFVVYRERNQLIGACAMAVAMGVGFSLWSRMRILSSSKLKPLLHAAALAVLVFLLHKQIIATRQVLVDEYADVDMDPCHSLDVRGRSFGDDFIAKVKNRYAMENPHCAELD